MELKAWRIKMTKSPLGSMKEFDPEAHLKWLSEERLTLEPSPQANARWQFNQDKATIEKLATAAQVMREALEYMIYCQKSKRGVLAFQNKAIEALAEVNKLLNAGDAK
jgi:hypothetical protein